MIATVSIVAVAIVAAPARLGPSWKSPSGSTAATAFLFASVLIASICIAAAVSAATICRGRVWALPASTRHHDVIRLMSEQGISVSGTRDQGFVDSNEGFVSRERARTPATGGERCPRTTR